MTYKARGRSITEVILAVIFVGFLTGFVVVLCIGNYYRAKKAMERQRQRRFAKLAGRAGNGVIDSPRSYSSSSEYSDEKASLLKRTPRNGQHQPPIAEDLLLHVEDQRP
mmetsp:Transcript_29535/g.48734  ORF Transcript_29535/g.48734 Transcript_29535/m.48734 type:complete len:109 (+) Transcript_29535:184-510(+)